MNIIFVPEGKDEFIDAIAYHKEARDGLGKNVLRSPLEGIGKPEPLRKALSGYWSRRITEEHRLVYRPIASGILLVQLRYHYKK